jgi:outer membrane receptor protein involved in Fe transport
VDYTDSSGTVIPAGTEMPSSPKLQVTSSASYVRNLGDWRTAIALGHTYQGAAWNNIAHDVQVGDYHLLGLTFNVTRHDLPFTPGLQLSVNNLLDERALTSALGGSEGPAGDTTPRPVVYTLPRTFRLNLTASFQ